MKLTPIQYVVYNRLNYDWKTLKELGGNRGILDKLVELGQVERKLRLGGYCYRKANKRIMVG